MPDMLDLLHYLFECDTTDVSSGEQLEARDKVRERLYDVMYGVQYTYSNYGKSSNSAYIDDPMNLPVEDIDGDLPAPFDPVRGAERPKAFIRPTDFDPDSAMPFGGALDAPLR